VFFITATCQRYRMLTTNWLVDPITRARMLTTNWLVDPITRARITSTWRLCNVSDVDQAPSTRARSAARSRWKPQAMRAKQTTLRIRKPFDRPGILIMSNTVTSGIAHLL
jgi:hypothetical protein